MSINQISIFLENKTGQLAELTGLLAEIHINLRAISIAETSDYGVLRIIADDAEKATSILLANGNILSMTPVTVVAVEDKPAGLYDLLTLLSNGYVPIEFMYSLFTHQNGKAYMVFRIDNEEEFIKLLVSHGLAPASAEELGLK